MAITFTHKSGSPGAGINIKLGTGKLLGRSSAGEGFVEEVTGPAGAIVGTSDTQTLTNKTITSAAFSGTHTGAFTTTGNITIDSGSSADFTLDKSASGQISAIGSQTAGSYRWYMALGDTVAESGSNAGSDFYIANYDDAGSFLGFPLRIIRATGNVTISNDLTVNGTAKTTATTVAGLPSAASAGAGARSFVTDANATTFASIVAGGGSNGVPVYSDGTNWRIG